MKQEHSFSAATVVQKLLQTLTHHSVERKSLHSRTLLHDEEDFHVDISEDNLPAEISELRANLGQIHEEVGRYASIMREIRYLLRA